MVGSGARRLGLPLIVDNTIATPIPRPGASTTAPTSPIHSLTKYIGGHGTSIGGVIVDAGTFDWTAHAERFPGLTGPDAAYHGVVWTEAVGNLAFIIRARTVLLRNTGAAITPMNSWLFLQGLETLHLRMERHSANALAVAQHLAQHPAVSWVSYPGLPDSPYKAVADRILTGRGYGGLLSFGVTSGREGGKRFIEALELFSHLANIGDAKSLAIHNATTTHSQLTPDELTAAGVPEDMVRLSIGIEHVDDLIADLDQALAASTGA
jgi:O-acetylhomoserine (thiol)-lyase